MERIEASWSDLNGHTKNRKAVSVIGLEFISYPHSNGGHTQLFKSENQECLLEGLKSIFEHIGGIPTTIWYGLITCPQQLIRRCDEDMERQHYKGIGLISELFEEDKKEFFKLPEVSFEVYRHEFAKADNYGKIKFDTRTYSTSPKMAGTQVMIRAGAHDVEILDNDHTFIDFFRPKS